MPPPVAAAEEVMKPRVGAPARRLLPLRRKAAGNTQEKEDTDLAAAHSVEQGGSG